jgi:putative lipoic acid-binding regulatory protein
MTETSNSSDTLFEFPCDFPLKVMGRKTDDFRSIVLGIVQKHAGPIEPSNIEERPSSSGSYLSLTCTFTAQSKAQLDELYRELTAHERVMVVL